MNRYEFQGMISFSDRNEYLEIIFPEGNDYIFFSDGKQYGIYTIENNEILKSLIVGIFKSAE